MAQDAFIVLQSLHCTQQLDSPFTSFEGTEPYIWPVLIRIDDATLQTQALVDVDAPIANFARVVIKSDMRAGQTAPVPAQAGVLRTRLEDNLFETHLILIVALWDEDESPDDVVQAGFRAFVSEIGAALGNAQTLLEIQQAEAANDEEALQAIAKAIQERVEKKVRAAIADSLSGPQKVAVKTGFLNLDDILGSVFKGFSQVLPTAFNLVFGQGTPNQFEIQGKLEVRDVKVDRCQAQVNAVRAAQAGVDGVNQEIRLLQEKLKEAAPAEKPFIQQQIKELKEEDLAPAQAVLGRALTALSICRSRLPPTPPGEAQQARRGRPGRARTLRKRSRYER